MEAQNEFENPEAFSAESPNMVAEVDALRRRLAALEANLAAGNRRSRWRRVGRPVLLAAAVVLAGSAVLVSQADSNALFIDADGNVRIANRLDVTGTIKSSSGILFPNGAIDADGNVEFGRKVDVTGTVRASGGYLFPDGTTQATAIAATSLVPKGAVVSFNSESCPSGWSDYKQAYGRFVRGIDKQQTNTDPAGKRAAGNMQEDAMRNITGSITGVDGAYNQAWPWGFRPKKDGAFDVKNTQTQYNRNPGDSYGAPGGIGTVANFDASQSPGVLVAPENRPKNVALLYCQKD